MEPKPIKLKDIPNNPIISDMPASASTQKDIYDEIALWIVITYEKQKRPRGLQPLPTQWPKLASLTSGFSPVFYRNGVAHVIPYNTKITLFE